MKKYFVILCMALMPTLAFTSCDDDDDDPPRDPDLALNVQGDYALTGEITIQEEKVPLSAVVLKVTKAGESKTKVKFDLSEISVGDVVYDVQAFDVDLGGAENNVNFDQKDVAVKVTPKGETPLSDLDAKLTFTGTIKDGKTLEIKTSGTVQETAVNGELKGSEIDNTLAENVKGEHLLLATVKIEGIDQDFPPSEVKLKIAQKVGNIVTFEAYDVDFTTAIYDFLPFDISLAGEVNAVTVSQKDVKITVVRKDIPDLEPYVATLSFEGTIKDGKTVDMTVGGMIDDDKITATLANKPEEPAQ